MKNTISLLFVLYFLILFAGGLIFYTKYMRNFSSIEPKPVVIEQANTNSSIYYNQNNILFRLNPKSQTDPLELSDIAQAQVQGKIESLDFNSSKSEVLYSSLNSNNNWEVLKGRFDNLSKEKVAFKGENGLDGFDDFTMPKFSPDKTKISVKAGQGETEAIFVKDLANDNWQKYAYKNGKISDYSWSKDCQKLIFCTSNLTKNFCSIIDLESKSNTLGFEREVAMISWDKTDTIFYLSQSNPPHIYAVNEQGSNSQQIDNLASPKKIVYFSINLTGTKIIYEVKTNNQSDLYTSSIDSTNRVQLTTDGSSQNPIFSPENTIAFLKPGNGIYIIEVDKTNEKKLVNLSSEIDKLLLWR